MIKSFNILVAGEINPDLILSSPDLEPRFGQAETLVQDAELTIGSSSAIFACGAARLGLRVAMIGIVGDDLFGGFMLRELTNYGVDVLHAIVDAGLQTGFSVILNRGSDRAILTHMGSMNALRADQVTDDLLRGTRHLHIASLFLQTALLPGLPDLFQRARALDVSTSLDTNWDPSGQWTGIAASLKSTTVFFPNEAEALALTNAPSVAGALNSLAEDVPIVAIKLGEQGAIAQRGDEIVRVPAFPVKVVDTVGAGDSFDAGFIYGYLQGWSLEATLRLAVACGSLSTRAHGGTAAQPTLQEALARR